MRGKWGRVTEQQLDDTPPTPPAPTPPFFTSTRRTPTHRTHIATMASDSQSQKTTFPITSEPRIASRLINACVMHVSQVSGIKRKKTKNLALLDDLGRFRLWAHGFDVLPSPSYDVFQDGDPKTVHGQFDEVLEHSEYLKEPTILLLASFASIILLTKFQNSPRSSSSSVCWSLYSRLISR